MLCIQTETEKFPVLAIEYITTINGGYSNTSLGNADGINAVIIVNDRQTIVPFVFPGHQLLGGEEVGTLIEEPDPPPDPDSEIDSDTLQQMLEEIL